MFFDFESLNSAEISTCYFGLYPNPAAKIIWHVITADISREEILNYNLWGLLL